MKNINTYLNEALINNNNIHNIRGVKVGDIVYNDTSMKYYVILDPSTIDIIKKYTNDGMYNNLLKSIQKVKQGTSNIFLGMRVDYIAFRHSLDRLGVEWIYIQGKTRSEIESQGQGPKRDSHYTLYNPTTTNLEEIFLHPQRFVRK